ncbi:MAG TPA: RDD family protein [Steroidobacteraceae bacterium]|jgi:uncharacterized RDD family membrane protein YckC
MNSFSLRTLGYILVLLCLTTAVAVHADAKDKAAASTVAVPEAASAASAPALAPDQQASKSEDEPEDSWASDWHRSSHRHGHNNDMVNIGRDSHLESGEEADSVVSVFGSSTNDGEAGDVVSVIGTTRINGPTHGGAVAVLGSVHANSHVSGDVVAVFGNVELGPDAEIGGDVTAVFGRVHMDPNAIVHGGVQHVGFGPAGDFEGVQAWFSRCLLRGRLLGFGPNLGWVWSFAFGALVFYTLLALMFKNGVERCVESLEHHTGQVALAALITILLTPIVLILLAVTLIGIPVVLVLGALLFCASLFGKSVMLAWIGTRLTGHRVGPPLHPAIAVLIGGVLAMLLFAVPVVGILTYNLIGFFGFGAVVFTLLQGQRARQAAKAATRNGGAAPPREPPPAAAAYAAGTAGAASDTSPSEPSATAQPPPPPPPPHATHQGPAAIPHDVLATLPRAGFWTRIAALLIDVVLISVLLEVSGSMLGFWRHGHDNALLVVLAVYGACMWKLRGSTVGGIVLDLRVVRADGRPLEWETAVVRALGCFLSLLVVGLGFIWIAIDPGSQAWHDKIAGTVVVRVPKGTPLV